MAFVVAPILFMITGLMVFGVIDFNEAKPTYVEMVSEVDVHCYNVNWFGQHGFQIVYQESLIAIAEKLDEYDIDFTSSEFYANQKVVEHLVVQCPHIDSRLDAPAEYDANIGIDAYPKCLERKIGEINYQEFCSEFIR